MATIAINYREMGNAAGDAAKVSKKLTAYANSINNTVLNKLNSYSGERTGNISSAVNNARNKKNQLEEDSRRYSDYSNNLKNLEDDCKSTDKRVADRVKSLTGTFKNCYGIKTNPILDAINRFMTSVANSNPIFRWIDNNIVDRFREGRDYLKSTIKEWYNYGGGKQLIKGVIGTGLEIAAAVIGFVGVAAGIITGIGAVTAVVLGIIGVLNGGANLINEVGAYFSRQNGNASMGYRLSKLDTFTDSLRTFSDNKGIHMLANVIDGIKVVCEVIDFLNDAGELIKKGYKWATNSLDSLKNIKWKDILSRGTIGQFAGKLKSTVADGLKSLTSAVKNWDVNFFKNAASSFATDFLYSLEARFGNFGDMKGALSSMKNIISFGKDLIKMDHFDFKNISKTLAANVVLPCVNIVGMDVVQRDNNGFFIKDSTGQFVFDKSEFVSLGNIFSNQLTDNILDLPKHLSFGDMMKSFNWVDKVSSFWKDGSGIVKKFMGTSNVSISIPKIYVPQINIQVNLNFNIRTINIPAGLAA